LAGKACLLPLKSLFMRRLCQGPTASRCQPGFQGSLDAIYLIAARAYAYCANHGFY
jgi:hypothetical protein